MSVVNLWTQDIMEKDLKLKRKKNYLILKATCENGLIDNASRKFINFWIANFISQNLKWELLLTKKKYFRQSRREINKDEVLQGKFVAWPFHFPSKPQMSALSASTFHLYILLVHFWSYKKGDFLNLTEPYHGSFSLACTNGQMVDG